MFHVTEETLPINLNFFSLAMHKKIHTLTSLTEITLLNAN